MKKIYNSPKIEVSQVELNNILAGSGGVKTGSAVGNGYNSSDESYSKRSGNWFDEQ